MLDIKKCSLEILENKIKRNFPTDDLKHELDLLLGEVKEAIDSKDVNELKKELADIAIFTISIARIIGIDLEFEIEDKINFNKTRTHKAGTYTLKDSE